MAEEKITSISFTDSELAVLNEVVRKHQVTLPSEDLVLLLMGKKSSPLPSVVIKVATEFEKRQAELQAGQTAAPQTIPEGASQPLVTGE
ncbi:MAG: hypothetical protein JHC33_10835 [Ignisphaera sp.]|nr:hypothetical protein [Ignisphaera sp.]